MLILADSGVLLRFLERADPQHAAIRTAVRVLAARGDELVMTVQNVALMATDLQQSNLQLQILLKAQNMKEMISLAADQLTFVKARAGQVDRQLKERFDKAYASWKAAWDNPLIAISSAPITRAQTVEFLELISLGPDILPLLMDKLTDPDEFFALVAVDRLSRPELQITRELDDDAILLGEQGRAIETVQRWAQAEA